MLLAMLLGGCASNALPTEQAVSAESVIAGKCMPCHGQSQARAAFDFASNDRAPVILVLSGGETHPRIVLSDAEDRALAMWAADN